MHNTVQPSRVADRPDDVFVLDIRPRYSYEETHIEGSHNLPVYDQVAGGNFIGLDASLEAVPDDEEIAVVCFSGSTAAVAAAYLRERGYDAKPLAGGIAGWNGPAAGTAVPSQ
ncbi:MAG: rhodanese-like domain-containing protein [Haloferacaceae archaeon]